MTKEKWYMTTGRESRKVKREATKVMFGDGGSVRPNTGWAWVSEYSRTDHRMFSLEVSSGVIVAYTLGEKV